MWFKTLFVYLLFLAYSDAENVRKKFCKDVDQNQCAVSSVSVSPCKQGPAYCNLKIGKKYVITVDLTPKFSSEKLSLSITADTKNDGSFSRILQNPKDSCGYLTCPLGAQERRIFDIDFSVDKTVDGKFPVQVKFWNPQNESQACCFTFNVKL